MNHYNYVCIWMVLCMIQRLEENTPNVNRVCVRWWYLQVCFSHFYYPKPLTYIERRNVRKCICYIFSGFSWFNLSIWGTIKIVSLLPVGWISPHCLPKHPQQFLLLINQAYNQGRLDWNVLIYHKLNILIGNRHPRRQLPPVVGNVDIKMSVEETH